jgi:hypothetical protein
VAVVGNDELADAHVELAEVLQLDIPIEQGRSMRCAEGGEAPAVRGLRVRGLQHVARGDGQLKPVAHMRVEEAALDRDAGAAHVEVEARIGSSPGGVGLGDLEGHQQHPPAADVHLEAVVGRADEHPFAGFEGQEHGVLFLIERLGILDRIGRKRSRDGKAVDEGRWFARHGRGLGDHLTSGRHFSGGFLRRRALHCGLVRHRAVTHLGVRHRGDHPATHQRRPE